MTPEEIEKRYLKLVDLVRRMRGHQKEFFKYRAKVDLDHSRRFEREVDKMITEEVNRQKSNQKELFPSHS